MRVPRQPTRETLAILLLTFVGMALVSSAQPVPSQERRLASPFPTPAAGEQWRGQAAFHSERAWHILWNGSVAGGDKRYVNVFDPQGTPLNPFGIPIPGSADVRLVRSNSGTVAVWIEGPTLRTALLSASARTQDQRHTALPWHSPDPSKTTIAAIASNGSRIIVIVREPLRALLLDERGNPVTEWELLGSSHDHRQMDLSATESGFAIFVWKNLYEPGGVEDEVWGRQVGNDGSIGAWTLLPLEERISGIAAGSDGEQHLLAWEAMSPESIRGVFLDSMLRVVISRFQITPGPARLGKIEQGEGSTLVFHRDSSSLHLSKIRISNSSPHVEPAVALGVLAAPFVADGRILLLEQVRVRDRDYVGHLLDLDTLDRLAAPFPAATSASDQRAPRIALGTDVDLVVWQELDKRRGVHQILATRVREGVALDDPPIRVDDGDLDGLDPGVTFDGENFLVVWVEQIVPGEGRVLARRVRPDGLWLDVLPIVVSDEWGARTEVDSDGALSLVVWSGTGDRLSTHGPAREIFGARVLPSGTVVDQEPLLISTDPWDHFEADVAAADEGFLVAWQTYRWHGHHSPVYNASSAAVVGREGSVGSPIILRDLITGPSSTPAVAWDGNVWLAAWTEERGNSHATRISRSGLPLDHTATNVPGVPIPVPLVLDVSNIEKSWLVVTDRDAGSGLRGLYLNDRLEPGFSFGIATSSDREDQPALASDGTRATIVYRRVDTNWPFSSAGRVRLRLFDAERSGRVRPVRGRSSDPGRHALFGHGNSEPLVRRRPEDLTRRGGIRHEDPRVQDPAPEDNHLLEDLEKPDPIAIIAIDDPSFIAAGGDVVNRTREVDAELSGHANAGRRTLVCGTSGGNRDHSTSVDWQSPPLKLRFWL